MKAQGATEYLVLMSVVLMIALVCIAILVWPTGTTSDVRKSQAGVKFGIGKIACEDLTKGLVAYYKFDDVPGATISSIEGMPDASFVNGTSVTSGVRDKAAYFDGTDDYVLITGMNANTVAGGKNTVAFWMNKSSSASKMAFGWGGTSYDLYFSSGCLGFNSGAGDLLGTSFPSASYVNKWVHVAAVFYNGALDATNNELWINGVKQDISGCGGSSSSGTARTSALIGTWSSRSLFFDGKIDDVHIYNRALSESEIEQLYENPGCP